jgi:hypothetical protein
MRRLGAGEMNDPEVWRAHLGRKASMRLKNHGDSSHPFTEAIGVIQSVKLDDIVGPTLTVVSRRGETRTALVADVLAAKIF